MHHAGCFLEISTLSISAIALSFVAMRIWAFTENPKPDIVTYGYLTSMISLILLLIALVSMRATFFLPSLLAQCVNVILAAIEVVNAKDRDPMWIVGFVSAAFAWLLTIELIFAINRHLAHTTRDMNDTFIEATHEKAAVTHL